MSARIGPDAVAAMAAAIRPLDTEVTRAAYRAGDYPRADRTRDVDKRYRWDLYWAAGGWRITPDAENLSDAHIDTALRSIVPPLEEVAA